MKSLTLVLTAAAAFLQGNAPLFEEKFADKLSDGWTWAREESLAWKIEAGALKIRTLPGTIWFRGNNAKNVLLRNSPTAGTEGQPVAIEVTVDSAPEANAEQAGLLWHCDDDNYVKIVRECLKPKDREGKVNVVLAREARGIPVVVGQKEDASGSYQLRLVWSGAKIAGFFKGAGAKDWEKIGDCEAPLKGEPSVGVAAHGAPAEAERWAKFSGFRVVHTTK